MIKVNVYVNFRNTDTGKLTEYRKALHMPCLPPIGCMINLKDGEESFDVTADWFFWSESQPESFDMLTRGDVIYDGDHQWILDAGFELS